MKMAVGNQRSTGVGNSLPGNRSREISTNTGAEKEDFPISLDEFLHECNQSPKSRVDSDQFLLKYLYFVLI